MTHLAKSILLLFFFSLCAAAIIVTSRFQPPVPPPTPHELYSVVNSQLAAFRALDFSRAYYHVASDIQRKFSVPQFEQMIRHNYAAMTQQRRIEFGLVQVRNATALVQVFFFASDGNAQCFLYNFVAEDGGWKIEGVERIRGPHSGRRYTGLRA